MKAICKYEATELRTENCRLRGNLRTWRIVAACLIAVCVVWAFLIVELGSHIPQPNTTIEEPTKGAKP